MDHAVVTGASGGLGEHYARYLARRGHNLLLSARSGDRLTALAEELQHFHRIRVETVPADLGTVDGSDQLLEASRLLGHADLLVNNAGFGTVGDFIEADPDRMLAELQLNCVTLTRLTRVLSAPMAKRGTGTVINIASTAAYQPIPQMAVYAASKAYVLQFSQALWSELRPLGVRVIAVCPGPTSTEFFARAGNDTMMRRRRTTEQVVQTTFTALERGVPSVIDGPANRVAAHLARLLPVRLVMRAAGRMAGGH